MSIFGKKEENVPLNYDKLGENLYINHKDKKLIIQNKTFDFSQVLSAKLVENGINNMVGSEIGNSNTIFGTSQYLVNQVNVEIKVKDISTPFFSVPFLKLGIWLGFDRKSKKYKEAYQRAQYCLSILEIIINDNKQAIEA